MQVRAIYKYARISAMKARELTREIQGKPVSLALDILKFTPKKAAALVDKTLRSAMANAENNAEMDVARLVVKEAVVGEGPTLKRFRPRARGGAGPIRKRTSHIRIILTDEIEIAEPKKKATAKKKKAAGGGKPKAKAKKPAPKAAAGPAGSAEPAPGEAETK